MMGTDRRCGTGPENALEAFPQSERRMRRRRIVLPQPRRGCRRWWRSGPSSEVIEMIVQTESPAFDFGLIAGLFMLFQEAGA